MLTLTGPPATLYGHRIELDGRLTPAVNGARIKLYRGNTFVTYSSAPRSKARNFFAEDMALAHGVVGSFKGEAPARAP